MIIGALKVGDRIGVRHTTGEWIPGVVVGHHEKLGAALVQTLADSQLDDPGEPVSVHQGVTIAVASWMQPGEHYKPATACEFRRKCATCKGFGSYMVRAGQTLADVLEGAHSGQEITCTDCKGAGFISYDPWEVEPPTTGATANGAVPV